MQQNNYGGHSLTSDELGIKIYYFPVLFVFFFFAFLERGGAGGRMGMLLVRVLQLLRHPQSLQNSKAAKICDASTEIRKLSDILRFFITCDCPILLNDVISKIRASKVKHALTVY